jgi:glyoxylase-like metal-dependent hydrolase (beta-lactamase superfamily II)
VRFRSALPAAPLFCPEGVRIRRHTSIELTGICLATLQKRAQLGVALIALADKPARRSESRTTPNKLKAIREDDMTVNVSRRSLLALGAGLSASTVLGRSALAKAPKLGTEPGYFYRFGLGDSEVTVVSDGPLPLGPPKGTFIGVPDDEVKKMLSDNFLSPDNVVLEQNSPIVNTGDKLILFDTGMGTAKNFGPTTGRQQKSMKEAGIKPEDIDAVVFSHAHIDHIGGVVDESGKVLFPNAQYYIAQSDLDYWTDEGKAGGPLKDFIVHARKNLMPVRDRLVFFKDGQEFLPGVQAIAAPGHTVGHSIFVITSNGKSFAYLGDLTHHPILLLEKPRMQFSYDTDPQQAAETRVKLLDMVASNKIPVLAYHYAWPGVGHIAKTAEGFHYYPEAMNLNI